MDLISIDYSSSQEEKTSKERIQSLANTFASKYRGQFDAKFIEFQDNHAYTTNRVDSAIVPRKLNFFQRVGYTLKNSMRKFAILYQRAWRQITRDKSLNIARLMSSLFSSLLVSIIQLIFKIIV